MLSRDVAGSEGGALDFGRCFVAGLRPKVGDLLGQQDRADIVRDASDSWGCLDLGGKTLGGDARQARGNGFDQVRRNAWRAIGAHRGSLDHQPPGTLLAAQLLSQRREVLGNDRT